LNGHLNGARRDSKVVECVGPYFKGWHRAYEKLEKRAVKACRAVQVKDIPALRVTFENYNERCAADLHISFWGISSFSLDDRVASREMFSGKPEDAAIHYVCSQMYCADLRPFSAEQSKAEVVPPPRSIFRVSVATKAGCKLVIAMEHDLSHDFCYVAPTGLTTAAAEWVLQGNRFSANGTVSVKGVSYSYLAALAIDAQFAEAWWQLGTMLARRE
jgi:hypothetical protein